MKRRGFAALPFAAQGKSAAKRRRFMEAWRDTYRFRSPRSPCPGFDAVFAFRRRSAESERPTSSLSLNCPPALRRTNRLSVPVLMSSRLLELRFFEPLPPRFAVDFDPDFVAFFAIENLRSENR